MADKAYGSWIVVERRKGKGRLAKEVNDGGVGAIKGGSHFSALIGVKEDEMGGISGKDGEEEDNGADLDMENRDFRMAKVDVVSDGVLGTKGKNNKGKGKQAIWLNKKKRAGDGWTH